MSVAVEDLIARWVEQGHVRPESVPGMLQDCRRAARRVLHPCSHGEMVTCARHRVDENRPGWIDAVPVRTRRTQHPEKPCPP